MTETPDPDATLSRLLALGVPYHLAVEAMGTRHLTPEDTKVVAAELEALGYEVTEPAWLREDPDGFRIVDRD